MAETLTLISTQDPENETIDLETFRRRLMQLKESRESLFDFSETSVSDSKKLMDEFAAEFVGKLEGIDMAEPLLQNLDPEYFDAYMEQLKKEISLTEEENMKISSEINNLTRAVEGDSNQLDGDLEKLAFSLKLIDTQGLQHFQAESGEALEGPMGMSEDQNFEISKLLQQIEKATSDLNTLQDLDYAFKRVQAISQIEDKVSSVKVLDFKGNCIRLSLTTHMPSSDGLLRHNLDCLIESSVVEHELLIEVVDNTLELHKAEIFPNDVSLDAIIHTVKSASHVPIMMDGSTLQYFVRQVQYRILVCTLRRLLLKDANQSRHSFEYADRDEMIITHLVGGIDAFIKIPQGWPLSSSALTLTSIKSSDIQSNSISLSFLCNIKELANALSIQTRGQIVRFADAIEEILVKEMRSKVH